MRPRGAVRSLGALLLLAASLSAGTALGCDRGAAERYARDYIEYSDRYTAACAIQRGLLRLIENTHPTKSIAVTLQGYFGKTRMQWRVERRLEPGAEPQPLACTASSGAPRHWEIISAEFVR